MSLDVSVFQFYRYVLLIIICPLVLFPLAIVCLSFDLRILIAPLVSSNSSQGWTPEHCTIANSNYIVKPKFEHIKRLFRSLQSAHIPPKQKTNDKKAKIVDKSPQNKIRCEETITLLKSGVNSGVLEGCYQRTPFTLLFLLLVYPDMIEHRMKC